MRSAPAYAPQTHFQRSTGSPNHLLQNRGVYALPHPAKISGGPVADFREALAALEGLDANDQQAQGVASALP
jgi:hypothetical protein